MLPVQHLNQTLQLLPEKAIYWEEQDALLIADPHFGKVTHFRKAGMAIPKQVAHKNLNTLQQLITGYKPEKVIFLGDLFHSEMNTEWLKFKELLLEFPNVEFTLIQGNHDILHRHSYDNTTMRVVRELNLEPYNFTHEPEEHPSLYNLSGHLHPGVRMQGKGRQSMRLPCFYFGKKNGVLPAFGEFTGLHIMSPKKDDHIFIISGKVVQQAL
ncbi:ligase-associated DNA damage response endonuclease PdeM [Owenweeksia hongkongensis]|uniref:ligase-associated DNA damage response endonuclease PdeM n=1 Tax=Owenweeksia hongkongensis TaxID=253245 RepID=UPI003A9213C2